MVTTAYTREEMVAIGKRIKFARRSRGLNQGQLCQRARIPSTKIISNFELGLDVPKGERLTLIAKALDVTEDYILKGETMAMSSVPKKPTIANETPAPVIVKPTALPETAKHTKREYTWSGSWDDYVWPNALKLKELRLKNKLSTADVGEMAGLTGKRNSVQAAVGRWESGKQRAPKYCLKALAKLYEVDIDTLLDPSKPPMKRAVNLQNLIQNKKKSAEAEKMVETVNPKTEIVVTGPEFVEQGERPIPKNAEQVFIKNVKAYLAEKKIDVAAFEKELGAEEGYFDVVIRHNPKIPLWMTLEIARKLNMSVEKLATDTKALEIEKQIKELEEKMAALKASIGM